jgi:uncharacterized protein involved in outer membrane biogenesis
MRRIGLIALAAVAIIVVAIGVFLVTFDINRYRSVIQSNLEQRLARKVTLGEMHLGLLPPRLRVQNISVGEDPGFSTQTPFIQTQELDVSFKLLPLLKKSLLIDSLTLQHPRFEFIKNQQGLWNFASTGSAPKVSPQSPGQPLTGERKESQKPNTAREKEQSGKVYFALHELKVRDGEIAITDLQAGSPRRVYDHIDANVQDLSLDQPFSLDAIAHPSGPANQEVRLEGKVGPVVTGQPANTPFHGTLTLRQVALATLSAFLNFPVSSTTEGTVSGESNIENQNGRIALKGRMDVQNPRLRGMDFGYPIPVQFAVTDDLADGTITIHSIVLKLGSMPVEINGRVIGGKPPAQLDLKVRARNISASEAARLAAAYGIKLASGTNVTGTAGADINLRGTAEKPLIDGSVAARDVQISGKELPQALHVPDVNLAFTPSVIQSDKFTIISGTTTMSARMAVQQYLSSSPLVDAELNAHNAQLPGILSLARAYGVAGADKVSGSGVISLDARAAGPVKGFTSSQVLRTLNGAASLDLNNVRYSGTDISYQLATIGGFLGKSNQSDRGFTNISKMTGKIAVKNGVAQTNDLQALLDIGKLGITGTGDLATQVLNLRVIAVLSKSFVDRLGGFAGIGGLLNTALANSQGELVIPATVTGTFQNPRFMPDFQQIAKMKLKGLVPNSSDPFSAVSGILGNILGGKGHGQAGEKQKPPSAVEQLLDIFRKKEPPPK